MNLERVNVNGLHSIRGQVALSAEQGNIPSRSIVGDYQLSKKGCALQSCLTAYAA